MRGQQSSVTVLAPLISTVMELGVIGGGVCVDVELEDIEQISKAAGGAKLFNLNISQNVLFGGSQSSIIGCRTSEYLWRSILVTFPKSVSTEYRGLITSIRIPAISQRW